MENENKQPILRYLLVGLAFVFFFVFAAYLAYRFTNRGTGNPIAMSSPTPTPVGTTSISVGSTPRVLLPAPKLPPLDQSRRLAPASPLAQNSTTSAPVYGTAAGTNKNILVAHDGKGNLLINNLTHEEYYQLELQKLRGAQEIAIAQTNQAIQREQAKLTADTARTNGEHAFAAERERLQAENALQARQIDAELKRQQLANQVELARLQNQLASQKLQTSGELALAERQQRSQIENQIRLLDAQTRGVNTQTAAESARTKQQIASQSQAELATIAAQSTREERLRSVASANQIREFTAQNQAALAQLSFSEKVRLAERAEQLAEQERNRSYSLIALRLQSQLEQLSRAQAHKERTESLLLQSQINQNLNTLNQRYNLAPHYSI